MKWLFYFLKLRFHVKIIQFQVLFLLKLIELAIYRYKSL